MHAPHPLSRRLFLLASLALASAATAQTAPDVQPHKPKPAPRPPGTNFNPNLIVLDPAHGGQDNGASLPGGLLEKDVTLALAQQLRTLLQGRGFTVLLTRENSKDDIPADTRVEQANRARPLACLLLHAATGGHGVHLYTSSLNPLSVVSLPGDLAPIAPWDTAQLATLPQSTRMVSDLTSSLNGIRVPLVTAHASVRPIDSLNCPAVALELAPIAPNSVSSNPDLSTPVSDPAYQQHVAEAVAQAMVSWRSHAEAAAAAALAAAAAAAQSTSPDTTKPPPPPRPKPKPSPKPVVPPIETPDIIPPAPAPGTRPAPIVRVPPPDPTGALR